MKHISKSQAQRFENGAVTSWEYEMQNANLNLAQISIKGRYPLGGFTSNLVSDAIVHVIGRNGLIASSDGMITELATNDQVHLSIGMSTFLKEI